MNLPGIQSTVLATRPGLIWFDSIQRRKLGEPQFDLYGPVRLLDQPRPIIEQLEMTLKTQYVTCRSICGQLNSSAEFSFDEALDVELDARCSNQRIASPRTKFTCRKLSICHCRPGMHRAVVGSCHRQSLLHLGPLDAVLHGAAIHHRKSQSSRLCGWV